VARRVGQGIFLMPEKLLLDEHEAAEMLGVSVSTLRRNRAEK